MVRLHHFIEQVNVSTKVDEDWRKFINERKEADISAIIEEEKLKPEETKRLINNAFRDGILKTTGTSIDRIMPPISRFSSENRAIKKQTIIKNFLTFLINIPVLYRIIKVFTRVIQMRELTIVLSIRYTCVCLFYFIYMFILYWQICFKIK
ncbi:type I restriction endonuclease subunit R, EcoR124 family [Aceticella autotrophica]|uniref:type I restriction endonuclease subunit R, EcoR124 family n=1 Tax=Aceticella autotrophica TaxID=2755338 RepID=UPI002542DF91|nr:hypothetical protein [Aceticella autotrophica]